MIDILASDTSVSGFRHRAPDPLGRRRNVLSRVIHVKWAADGTLYEILYENVKEMWFSVCLCDYEGTD